MSVSIIGTKSREVEAGELTEDLYISEPLDRVATGSGTYLGSTGVMVLGTLVADSCIFCLDNPISSGKYFYIDRLTAIFGFGATLVAGTYYISFGVTRATGTSANGTVSRDTTQIARLRRTDAFSSATYKYGPAAIAGLTEDAPTDFRTWFFSDKPSTPVFTEQLSSLCSCGSDAMVIDPGTSLAVFTRVAASKAGVNVALNVRWTEITS